jgi:hypothetical protein
LVDDGAAVRIADAGTLVRDAALDLLVETDAAPAEDGAGVDAETALGVLLEDMLKARRLLSAAEAQINECRWCADVRDAGGGNEAVVL